MRNTTGELATNELAQGRAGKREAAGYGGNGRGMFLPCACGHVPHAPGSDLTGFISPKQEPLVAGLDPGAMAARCARLARRLLSRRLRRKPGQPCRGTPHQNPMKL